MASGTLELSGFPSLLPYVMQAQTVTMGVEQLSQKLTPTRGSHLQIAYKSICDQDQKFY